MITGELRSKIDRVWEAFWTGGLSNPITVIEQMTYLLFIRRLDDLHTQREQKAAFLKKNIGLAFVPPDFANVGQEIKIDIRGKQVGAVVVQTPFYKRQK